MKFFLVIMAFFEVTVITIWHISFKKVHHLLETGRTSLPQTLKHHFKFQDGVLVRFNQKSMVFLQECVESLGLVLQKNSTSLREMLYSLKK